MRAALAWAHIVFGLAISVAAQLIVAFAVMVPPARFPLACGLRRAGRHDKALDRNALDRPLE